MPTNKAYRTSGFIAVLGLLTLLVGLTVMLALPGIRYAAWATLALGILLLAIAFILDYRQVSRALSGRRGRFSTGTTVMASIFIGITLLVNAISISNYYRFDATGVAQFTLTQQTKDVLRDLKTPVQILLFFTPADPTGLSGYVTSLLAEYQNYTDQLSVKTIDPDEHPDQARQYGITQYQTVVFKSDKHRRLVSPDEIVQLGTDQQGNQQIVGVEAEHPFTSAILEVTGTVQKKVYFLIGHGESDINSQAPNGYSRARIGLQDNLYQVGVVDFILSRSLPEDSAALIIAAPRQLLPSSEIEIIEDYLKKGGRLMILTNPESPPGVKQLLSRWGVNIETGTVIDPSSYIAPSIDSPKVPQARSFFGLPETYFPGATALIPQAEYSPKMQVTGTGLGPLMWTSDNSSIQMVSLVRTSQDSWLEKNFNPDKKPEFNEGTDLKGPLNLSFLIVTSPVQTTPTVKSPRLLVIGDSDFASNQHYYNGNNGDLFINSIKLLTEGTELISIERKVLPFRRLIVGPEVAAFIQISSIGLLPLLVLVTGGIIWWRRR